MEGHDVVAKVRILAALVFGQAIPLDHVIRRGITEITPDAVQQVARDGCRLKLVASVRLRPAGSGVAPVAMPLDTRVEPLALPLTDPLARVDGVLNALTIETDTVHAVTIIGPGAGPEQAGQGMFADLVAIARATEHRPA